MSLRASVVVATFIAGSWFNTDGAFAAVSYTHLTLPTICSV